MKIRRDFQLGLFTVYVAMALVWLVGGDLLLALLSGRQGVDWGDFWKDVTFLVSSAFLLVWLSRRYADTCRELSSFQCAVFDSANDAFLVFTPTGVIVAANRKASETYGYPLERLVGMRGRDIVHPDSYPMFEQFLAASPAELEAASFESEDRRADGSRFPVEVRGAMVLHHGTPHRLAIVRDISPRVRMERSRATEEARWGHALNFIDDAICLVALDDTIMEANQAFYRLTGLSPDEAVGRNIAIIHPKGPDIACPVCQARRERKDAFVPMASDHPCNAFGRPIEVMVRMVRDSQDELQYVLLGIRDLSQLEEMREQLLLLTLSAEVGGALVKGRELHRMLQSCAELLVARLDGAFARIWTLSPGEQMLRLRASAGLYTHVDGPHSLVAVDDHAKVGSIALHKRPYCTSQVVGDPQITDQEWARREGMVAFAGHPLMIGEKVVGVMALFARQPLSPLVAKALAAMGDQVALGIDRAWGEEQLLRKNRALHIVSECNAILVRAQGEAEFLRQICEAIVDKGGYRLAWIGLKENDPECTVRVVGSAGDTVGYLDGIAISWADNELGRGPTGTAIRSGEVAFCHDVEEDSAFAPWREEARQYGLVRSVAIPLREDGDATIGALNIYAEDTEPFSAEEIALLQELAVDVAYGIRVLHDRDEAMRVATVKRELERQVRQGQKMEAIGTLAGGIAHDFNNILAAILGFSDLAKHKLPPNSDLHSDLDNVLQAGKRAKELVGQILAFSRQAEQERRPIEMALIVKEAMKLLRASLPANIEFRLDIEANADTVLADPTQIHQVVMNLCTNAYHAMRGNDSGVLAVSLKQVELVVGGQTVASLGPGHYLLLTVSDTGCGMTQEIRERIFEPYFTTKQRGDGTGMGLAMVHGIVRGCSGDITVESVPGSGSTVRVYLPREAAKATAMERIISQQLPGGSERVLVVDDEPTVLRMHTHMLTRLGYQVTAFGSSTEALAEFSRRPGDFDLLLTDMAMPVMPGDVLVEKIKTIRADIPVLVCTGFSDRLTSERAQAIGIGTIIMKPLLFGELATAIRQFLDK